MGINFPVISVLRMFHTINPSHGVFHSRLKTNLFYNSFAGPNFSYGLISGIAECFKVFGDYMIQVQQIVNVQARIGLHTSY